MNHWAVPLIIEMQGDSLILTVLTHAGETEIEADVAGAAGGKEAQIETEKGDHTSIRWAATVDSAPTALIHLSESCTHTKFLVFSFLCRFFFNRCEACIRFRSRRRVGVVK